MEQKSPSKLDALLLWIVRYGFIIGGIGLILCGVGCFLYQIYFWLRYGAWFPISLTYISQYLGIDHPQMSWAGFQRIIDWIMDSPASVWLILSGATLLFGSQDSEKEAQ
jgi:hypothetical protein